MIRGDVRYRFVIDTASLKELEATRRWDEERYSASAN